VAIPCSGSYIDLYASNKQKYQQLRENYAFPIKMILNEEKARKLSAFFFWSAWAASTNNDPKIFCSSFH
jgi:nitric oxide reductase subunit B